MNLPEGPGETKGHMPSAVARELGVRLRSMVELELGCWASEDRRLIAITEF